MALPKEPRQKMINMMYLVLTALLALNVSAEIINAFKTVDNSLLKSNSTLTASSDAIYKGFAESLEDPKTREKAAQWKPKADQVKKLSADMTAYIEELKTKLKDESKYNEETGEGISNLDAPTRLMDTQGEGEKLRLALEKYKSDLMAIDPEVAKELQGIPIDLEKPKSSTGKDDASQTWTTAYFHMTPTIAAMTILSKFQNDVKNSENKMVAKLFEKVGGVVFKLDKFEPMVAANSTYLMPGEQVELKAGLGAFNSSVKPEVLINGKAVPVSDNGVAEVKMPAGASGAHKLNIEIKYLDPNTGEPKSISKPFEYTVGQPSGISVMPTKMNVLFVGVDNPLTITAGAGSEKVTARISNGSLSKVGGSNYVAKPTSQGEASVDVMVDGKSVGKVAFRVKYLPAPNAYVGTFDGGQVPTAQFKAMGGVRAAIESEFEAKYSVLSYTIADLSAADYNPVSNNGAPWSGSAKSLVDNLKPGRGVYIDNIKAQGPDGRTITLKPLSFILR